MSNNAFYEHPIQNSPYEYPQKHWELDGEGQPTQKLLEMRRPADFITPIPLPKKLKGKAAEKAAQEDMLFGEVKGISTDEQKYLVAETINTMRRLVDRWRALPEKDWGVTPETARLLRYWRHHPFNNYRPFFCQIEAVETIIWLTEVAPSSKQGKLILAHLEAANMGANPGLSRLALKLATGAGKTTVMAMIIAWQTINAVRRPGSRNFTRGFLVVAPGLTIRDRLRILLPNDPDNYYATRELVPADMREEIQRAKIVITNYHAFKLRERIDISKVGRQLLQGRRGEAPQTMETEGQMIQRVIPALMGMKNILVINDEAHHCYREKPGDAEDTELKGEEKQEAEKNREAARVWISGLETVQRTLGLSRVVDLSATPFFLSGSGYKEGTLFPWTMSDFSLMDAIECGIVKLPRVPVAENIPGSDMPMYRNLWENIRKDMPRKGRGTGGELDPLKLPTRLITAMEALYGHYEKIFALWEEATIPVPPCFIFVCQNTAISKLVYDYVSGFTRENEHGAPVVTNGRFPLFRNFDEDNRPFGRPNTLLIDSEQLESDEALDDNFRTLASDEIERFRREIIARTGDVEKANNISDKELLREAMNTVGKPDTLGANIRCVVSVSMLTEGWDANNVTHILGIRAFGTQLLCEQVVGRALRRYSYELNGDKLLEPEYADIFGVPFNFATQPIDPKPQPVRPVIQVQAVRPDRDALEIRFPRVEGYRTELPEEKLAAKFNDDHVFVLTPEMVGPTEVRNSGIIGETVDLNVKRLEDVRIATVQFELATHLLYTKFRDPGEEPKLHLFGQLKRITAEWLATQLQCKGGTYPAQLLYRQLADMACGRITAAISNAFEGAKPIKALLDPYNPEGSTAHVRFATSRDLRWNTGGPPPKNHVNWVILDSDWEGEFCRVAEAHPKVLAYTKNHALGFEVPYRLGSETRRYRPDFIVLVDDGHGPGDPLHLVVEIKGYRREDAKEKKATMDSYWIPGVNNLKSFGRWAFAEFTDMYDMQADFAKVVEENSSKLIDGVK
jgi:type III restriction enzyme